MESNSEKAESLETRQEYPENPVCDTPAPTAKNTRGKRIWLLAALCCAVVFIGLAFGSFHQEDGSEPVIEVPTTEAPTETQEPTAPDMTDFLPEGFPEMPEGGQEDFGPPVGGMGMPPNIGPGMPELDGPPMEGPFQQAAFNDMEDWFLYNFGLSSALPECEDPKEGQVRIACVGDSITYGYGVMDWAKNNYPAVLQNLLGQDYNVQNYGTSGRSVQKDADYPYSVLKTYTKSKEYDADILVFMMGSNDSKAVNWKSADAYRTALCEMLDSYGDRTIILCTPAACFFVGMPNGTATNHGLQPAVVTQIAAIVREVAQERGYVLVDIYELTEANPQWFALDGVHPDVNGAAAIADAVYEAIMDVEALRNMPKLQEYVPMAVDMELLPGLNKK